MKFTRKKWLVDEVCSLEGGVTSGVTNNGGLLGGKHMYLYFGERDDTSLYDVYEEANFLSHTAEIDIDVLESSRGNYHLVSYDLLSKNELLHVERLEAVCDHYPNFDELDLSRVSTSYQRLRIGEKSGKPHPKFLKRFRCPDNPHVASQAHLYLYKVHCGVPKIRDRYACWPIAIMKIWCTYRYGFMRALQRGSKPMLRRKMRDLYRKRRVLDDL